MTRIGDCFDKKKQALLIAYVTVGYPNIDSTLEVVPLLASNGVDMIELGIPFSDPLADGVTIQNASIRALDNGVTPDSCLDVAKRLRNVVSIPLIFMSYFNPVLHYGITRFGAACRQSGIDGLIIPDLPPEEGLELETASKENELDLIYLLAPTSNDERIELVANRSSGFIYLVSVTGVTGARETLPKDIELFVNRVRKVSSLPLCLGFGISTSQQAVQVANIADGVIIGSRIIQHMEKDDGYVSLSGFIKEVKDTIDSQSSYRNS